MLHEGIGIIDEAVRRGVKSGLVIFYSHASWCTGGQPPMGDVTHITEDSKIKKFYLNYDTAKPEEIIETLTVMGQF